MFKPIIKILGLCFFALMLPLTACDPNHDDEPGAEINPIPEGEEITREITSNDIREALLNSKFEATYIPGHSGYNFTIAATNPDALEIKGAKIEISKVEYYLDGELGTIIFGNRLEYVNEVYIDDYSVTHTYYARIYASTNTDNETYITLHITNFDTGSDGISKKEIQTAIIDSNFKILSHSLSYDIDGSSKYGFGFEFSNPDALVVNGKDVKLIKIEYFFDDAVIYTDRHPRIFSGVSCEISNYNIAHKLYAHIHGLTCASNETYITFNIWEYTPENVTTEEVQVAMAAARFNTRKTSSVDEFGTTTYTFEIEPIFQYLHVKGQMIYIKKAELYVNNILVDTKHNEEECPSFRFNYSSDVNPSSFQVRVYGCTNSDNETYITFFDEE